MTDPRIRPARPGDEPAILRLIRDLATYEREPDAVRTTEADLTRALFTEATASAHVAEVGGEVVGIAVWFVTFSTWTGRNGLWLEDLYVDQALRGEGLGEALLDALTEVCRERGYPRLEWHVLDWNEPAIGFYRAVGARPLAEWTAFRRDVAAPESTH